MNEKKTFGILAVMLLMLIGMVGLASAATTTINDGEGDQWEINLTIYQPTASNGSYTGSQNITVYFEHNRSIVEFGGAWTIEYNLTGSIYGNLSVMPASLGSVTNATAGMVFVGTGEGTEFGYEVDTTTWEDTNDYTVAVAVLINTTELAKDSVSSVLIDNTAPAVPTIEHPAEKQILGNSTMVLKALVTSNATTQCTFYFVGPNPGSSVYTVKDSENGYCNVSISKASENTFTVYATATDETDTSANSPNRVFSIDTESKGGAAAAWYITESAAETAAAEQAAETGAGKDDRSTTLLLLVAIIIIVFIINKKPGK